MSRSCSRYLIPARTLDTPLIWACIEGRVACVRVLLEHGADVNVVNQHGATTLICSVMIGEDPEEDESDDARAEIIKLLLAKNPKLVNFQDREGSTAMHLAASCGYLQCVKMLLACGADITLRNAIGQTPLEEAEQTGLDESDVCVEYLRTIWQTLEEEAAARMMTMLEMEEQSAARTGRSGAAGGSKAANGSAAATGASASSSSKKSKKKNKKLKRKAAKQQAQQATETPAASASGADVSAVESKPNGPTENASSGESSDDDGDDDNDGDAPRAVVTAVVTPVMESHDEAANNAIEQRSDDAEDVAAVAGAWTTVGKKHKAVVAPAADALDDSVSDAAAAARRTQKAPAQSTSPALVSLNCRFDSHACGRAPLSLSHSQRSCRSDESSQRHHRHRHFVTTQPLTTVAPVDRRRQLEQLDQTRRMDRLLLSHVLQQMRHNVSAQRRSVDSTRLQHRAAAAATVARRSRT